MVYDILLEKRDENDLKGISKAQQNSLMNTKKEELLEFSESIFQKIADGKLDIDDTANRYFRVGPANDLSKQDEIAKNVKYGKGYSRVDDPYSPKLSPEVEYFLYKISETIRNRFHNDQRNITIYSKILELLFKDVFTIINNFSMHLTPYLDYKKVKNTSKMKLMLKNHDVNLSNILEVFRGYIIGDQILSKGSDRNEIVINELNIEVQRSSQMKLERIFLKIIGNGKNYKPDFSCFENLINHSYQSEGAALILNLSTLPMLHAAWMGENRKKIFGRKEPQFDFLYNNLSELTQRDLNLMKQADNKGDKGMPKRLSLELNTRIFVQEFDEVKKCRDWEAWLTDKYSLPMHKNMINEYIPDTSNLSEQIFLGSLDDFLNNERQKDSEFENKKEDDSPTKSNEGSDDEFKDPEYEKKKQFQRQEKIVKEVESKIEKRRRYFLYISDIFENVISLNLLIREMKHSVEQKELNYYETTLINYQFGLANHELKKYSSIDVSLKNMRKLFRTASSSTVSKELFENLSKKQKEELKSYKKIRFKKLLDNGTIKCLLPQLEVIYSNLRIVFYEDNDFRIHVEVIYKENTRSGIWGKALNKSK